MHSPDLWDTVAEGDDRVRPGSGEEERLIGAIRPWLQRGCSVALLLLVPGCYLSHGVAVGADGGARADGGVRADGAIPSVTCDESKLRTSGLVEPWAPGSSCELLVACVDTSEAMAAARSSFPELACRDVVDPLCVGVGATSCTVYVGTLSVAEYDAACALTLRDDVAALVCAGDL